MTAQVSETLLYQGETLALCAEPLADYFDLAGLEPKFSVPHTACWRGYVGTWEIVQDRFYLVGIGGQLEDGTAVTLETFFPGFPDRVFAHWYSGTVRVPQGKMLKYVHAGYASQYERDLLITIRKGVVTGTTVRENGTATDPEASEGYGVGAFTTIPRKGAADKP